jgi:hypothetical protein
MLGNMTGFVAPKTHIIATITHVANTFLAGISDQRSILRLHLGWQSIQHRHGQFFLVDSDTHGLKFLRQLLDAVDIRLLQLVLNQMVLTCSDVTTIDVSDVQQMSQMADLSEV